MDVDGRISGWDTSILGHRVPLSSKVGICVVGLLDVSVTRTVVSHTR